MKKIECFFFFDTDFGITDAKYNGKENENQEKYGKALQRKPIINKFPLQKLQCGCLLWRLYPCNWEDASCQYDTGIQVSPGRLNFTFLYKVRSTFYCKCSSKVVQIKFIIFQNFLFFSPLIISLFQMSVFQIYCTEAGGRRIIPNTILIQNTSICVFSYLFSNSWTTSV